MKKGDRIIIRDSSYSKVVTANGLEEGYLTVRKEQGVVVEVGCKFPNPHEYQQQYGNIFNNTVVITDSGKVVFIEERFLRPVPPKHKVMIDIEQDDCAVFGNIIEISDKLYKEIKRDS